MGWWGDGASDSNEEVQAERGGDVHVLQAQGRGRVGEEHGERVLGVHQQVVLPFHALRQAVLRATRRGSQVQTRYRATGSHVGSQVTSSDKVQSDRITCRVKLESERLTGISQV